MTETVVIGAGFGGKFFAELTGAPCLSRSNGFDLNKNLDGVLAEVARLRPKVIVNFAAQGMVAESWQAPADWMQTNVVAQTQLITGLARFDFLEKYLLFTTPEVYGSTDRWMPECWAFNPSTPYAASRAAGDWVAKLWHAQHGFPVIFTRAANIYGEGQQLFRIIPKAILFGLTGRKLPLHGGGRSIRAFVHMDDVTTALHMLMARGIAGETYHLSPRHTISIRELVAMIEIEIGAKDIAEVVSDRAGKDQAYLLDPSRIESMGWRPKVTLKQGIARVHAWIQQNLEAFSRLSTNYVHQP